MTATNRRRTAPTTEEVIAAVRDGGNHGYMLAMDFEAVRRTVQKRLRTTATNAREWLRAALTDPAQTDYVWLFSNNYGVVERIVIDPTGLEKYVTADIHPQETSLDFPPLFLDQRGNTTTRENAAKRHDYVITGRLLDSLTGVLEIEYRKARAEKARGKYDEAKTTKELIGEDLALIRGMCFAAGIDLLPPDLDPRTSRLEGWAERAPKRGYVARVELDLRNTDVKKLADWLRTQGVKPVQP